jgi:hypothetical protein
MLNIDNVADVVPAETDVVFSAVTFPEHPMPAGAGAVPLLLIFAV